MSNKKEVEIKCRNCGGSGAVSLGEGVKGIVKCPICNGSGKLHLKENEKENSNKEELEEGFEELEENEDEIDLEIDAEIEETILEDFKDKEDVEDEEDEEFEVEDEIIDIEETFVEDPTLILFELAEFFRLYRDTNCLKRKELAKKLGISKKELKKIEKAENHKLTLEEVENYLNILGLDYKLEIVHKN